MDRYTRGFVFASLVYLAAGGLLGLYMMVIPESYPYIRFAHIHILLAGFMAMMIFGVGYFILPRFAARSLRWPALVGPHFWAANASLVAMAIAYPVGESLDTGAWTAVGHAGAMVQALSFVLFSANLGLTLTATPRKTAPEKSSAAMTRKLPMVGATPSSRALAPGTPVAEVVDRKEGAREMLVEAGLRPLADPRHLEMVRQRGLTLGYACANHGIPVEDLLARLEALPDRPAPGTGVVLGSEAIIGEVVARYPQTEEVLRRRFGEGCFTCPGFSTETLAQGALMHGVAVEDLLADLRAAIDS
jgi:hybrid cluster-associated redox disulfide protein